MPQRRARSSRGLTGVAAACVLAAVVTLGLAISHGADVEVAVTGTATEPPQAPLPGTLPDPVPQATEAPDPASEAHPEPGAAAGTAGRGGDRPGPTADREPPAGTEPEPPGGPGRLVVHHVGDVNLDPDVVTSLATLGYDAVWDGARDTFAEADLVLANLECAPTRGGVPQPKQFLFRCELDALPAMREAGVDVVTLANNHSGDFGVPAMVEGVTNVEAAGMVAVGVGADEQEAYAPRVVEVNGWRIAILGFGGVVPTPEWTARDELPGQATGYDPDRMAEAVAAAHADADLVIATVHWGTEGALEPRPEDRPKARAMIAAGADVVFGHHAHRLQPLEVVDGAPVFWNLGNFVWPRLSQASATTAVAEWIVEPDGTVISCLLPAEIDVRGVPAPTGEPRRCQ